MAGVQATGQGHDPAKVLIKITKLAKPAINAASGLLATSLSNGRRLTGKNWARARLELPKLNLDSWCCMHGDDLDNSVLIAEHGVHLRLLRRFQ